MWGLSGFLLGLVFGRFLPIPSISWVWLALGLWTVTARSLRIVSLLTFLLFGLSVGWLRGAQYTQQLSNYQNFYDTKVVLVGRAATDGTYTERAQLGFDMDSLEIVEPTETTLIGKLGVEGFGEPSVLRGDFVQVEGKLFPSRGSKQGRISFAELKTVGRDDSALEAARRDFVAGMQSSLPEPQASFGLGLLIGQRSTLPKTTLDTLAAVGLTHIVAVSGYNLTIIVRAVKRLLGKKSKYQALVACVMLIAAFLVVTGLSASIVRAAIVSFISLAAWYWGRTVRPLLLLLLAATITAAWQPTYIWSDIGWHLSFLAFYGVLVLAPLVIKRISKEGLITKPTTTMVIESLCAWVMTAPLIIFIFHELSLIALVANALVLPLVPLAMLLSLAAGLGGSLAIGLSGWLALPAKILLTYILDIASLLSRLPKATTQALLSSRQMSFLYLCLMAFSFVLWHKTDKPRAKILE